MGKKRAVVRKQSGLPTLIKLAGVTLVSLCFLASAFVIYQGMDTVEQVWAEKERGWKQEESRWQMEVTGLQQTKEKLEYIMGGRSTDPRKVHPLAYTPRQEHAIVTAFGGNNDHPDWSLALALFHSLQEVGTRVPNLVALNYDEAELPPVARRAFKKLGVDVRDVRPGRKPPTKAWGIIWGVYEAFSLVEFERVLFMDHRSFVVDNVDHLLELVDPADMTNKMRMVHTALQQHECEFWEPCKPRTVPSHRMFVARPSFEIYKEINGRILSKSEEVIAKEAFTMINDLLDTTPFPEEKYDIPFGECKCNKFKSMRSYVMDCVQSQDLWGDVLGRVFVEQECMHELYITWMRLFVDAIERMDR